MVKYEMLEMFEIIVQILSPTCKGKLNPKATCSKWSSLWNSKCWQQSVQ